MSKEEIVETSGDKRNEVRQGLEQSLNSLPEQYEILGKISQGGMGAIYKAQNRYTGALVAIKILKTESSQKEKALARFIVEARAASSLNHPQVCQVRDFGLTNSEIPYLVMDWINGLPLGKKVQSDGPQTPTEAVNIFQQICSGLEHAHSHKVVHRDLKPDNIMLTRNKAGHTQVHIVDFGIAKLLQKDVSKETGDNDSSETDENVNRDQLTTTGTVVGTPLFMSPEQARASSDIDERSDIYSFGCLMYYVLTGEPPLVGASAFETIAKHLHQAPADFPARLKIPAALKAIVFKCMEKKPSDRYQSIVDISSDLKKFSKGITIDRKPLVLEREKKQKNLFRVVSFILGFGLMYAISIGVQNLLDSGSKGPTSLKNEDSKNESADKARTMDSKNASEKTIENSVKLKKLKNEGLHNKSKH